MKFLTLLAITICNVSAFVQGIEFTGDDLLGLSNSNPEQVVEFDSGASLMNALGFESQEEAANTIKRVYAIREDLPLNDVRLLQEKKAVNDLLESHSLAQAIAKMDTLIAELDPQLVSSNSKQFVDLVVDFHLRRIEALKLQNRFIEALVEGQKLKRLCREQNACSVEMVHKLIEDTEAELSALKGAQYYAKLQVNPGSSAEQIKRSFMNLMKLLHPDKNFNADSETQTYLAHLLELVQEANRLISSEA